jgi:hypothetical protein
MVMSAAAPENAKDANISSYGTALISTLEQALAPDPAVRITSENQGF